MMDLPQKLGALLSGAIFIIALIVSLFDHVKLYIVICRAVTLFFIFLAIGWVLGLVVVYFFKIGDEQEQRKIDFRFDEESGSSEEGLSDTPTQAKADEDVSSLN